MFTDYGSDRLTMKKQKNKKSIQTNLEAVDIQPESFVETPIKVTSPSTSHKFPIIGIGASAGGLAAFEAFFLSTFLTDSPGMAFVLVQHLAPDHKSILTDIIQRYTKMTVYEVEDGMEVLPNCLYIIPPGYDMALLSGSLNLLEPSEPHGHRLPIDFFFRSLALDQRENAIGVILSGTGSDGSLGIRAIKGEGGMIIAQSPDTCEYDGMPRSAIATGMVDYELPPAKMLSQIILYTTHASAHQIQNRTPLLPKAENLLKKVFILLRDQMGHDFSHYKLSTIQRRIERRMAVQQINTLDDYVKFIQTNPTETEALFHDMLIGVTNFFRDPIAFSLLEEQVIPTLFAIQSVSATIRVWVPGCSTGEEAYSIAILLQEQLEREKRNFNLQVFATDIDTHAVSVARIGKYPASIRLDITPERLARFFVPEPNGSQENPSTYRIQKNIRELLIFSEQDIIKDPPFSKIDLISCRNLMIYMGGDLQKKLIPLFHYALNPRGFLFLGTSETIGTHQDLFTIIDRKSKIYQRKNELYVQERALFGMFLKPIDGSMKKLPNRTLQRTLNPSKIPLREITETALIKEVISAGILVNNEGNILYLHGRTGLYLELTTGESGVNNILRMAREGLTQDLTMALNKAAGTRKTVRCPNLRVKTNGDYSMVNLTVSPVSLSHTPNQISETEPLLFIIILQKVQEQQKESTLLSAVSRESEKNRPFVDVDSGEFDQLSTKARIAALTLELHNKEEYLQTTIEELETSNEELKSANEEMQSVNEELQSTNEELETSKEELQSINEELATVNSELQSKVTELSRVNNDLNNLLSGTGIATIFIDYQLKILRFTPTATRLINLIATDVGRSIGHIVSNIKNYSNLIEDVHYVLETLLPIEHQVQTLDEKWFTLRILPYRTLDNIIEGAVITFVDITKQKVAEAERLEIEQKYRIIHELLPEAHVISEITDSGHNLGFVDCNQPVLNLLGITRKQFLSTDFISLSPERQPDGLLSHEKSRELYTYCIAHKSVHFDWLCTRLNGDPLPLEIMMTVYKEHNKTYFYSVWRDMTGLTRKASIENSSKQFKGDSVIE